MTPVELLGWDRLRHGGLLLDTPRLRTVAEVVPDALPAYEERELRRFATAALGSGAVAPEFVSFVLDKVCGFTATNGTWQRGSQVGAEFSRRSVTGEVVKPRQVWRGPNGATLPVFLDAEARLGVGRGRKSASQTVQWLRAGGEPLALLTNGRQWRLVFAGLDFDAWCEWDVDLWFEEGALSPQVHALRTLLSPRLWTPASAGTPSPLLQAILDSRKGQAELSAVLGERVREAVEMLVQGHGEVLKEQCAGVDPADIYRAAVRVVMRMVVVLFAESRELLPRDNALYHGAYGLGGLLEELEKVAARGGNRLARSWNAWPRILALFRLVHEGSHHPALPVPAYGGDLFALGASDSADGLSRALAVFESAAFDRELLNDRDVHRLLERITRTKVKVRQGRGSVWVPAPVDFSDLSSEYIGILYEGLLDFELKTAPAGDPVVFLAVGNQPALPLSRLDAMDDRALTNLLEKMKDTSAGVEEAEEEAAEESSEEDETGSTQSGEQAEEEECVEEVDGSVQDDVEDGDDRHVTRTRAETWARRAVEVCKLVRKPRGTATPQSLQIFQASVERKARQLVARVVLPGEWYVLRWGGTRKGSGTFYTRPALAVPTVHRTLRPLAYTPPTSPEGTPDLGAPTSAWIPRTPEEILALKVCDPGCGSGTFPVAALRFLTEALFASLHHHNRVSANGERAVVRLLALASAGAITPDEHLGQELLPCRPDDALFEPRLKAVLRRHVVERCIYGVDLDPLAVELCRLALWIETMDRTLPFSFLDHKVKCGNSLVGAWFDQFLHYPAMAWKNRQGGDKSHSNGVHFKKGVRSKAFNAFVADKVTPDLRRHLEGRTLFTEDQLEQATTVHDNALGALARVHDLPVQECSKKARLYRDELVDLPAYQELKARLDTWCACWFWPADQLDHAPLPSTFGKLSNEALAITERLRIERRFFHWELEFPDAFSKGKFGFDSVLGNPPWETIQPASKEFFSNLDPLYRSYGKQEALRRQHELFSDRSVEEAWVRYNERFNEDAHWVKCVAFPLGDPEDTNEGSATFSLGRGASNIALHSRWRAQRNESMGYAKRDHPYRYQGVGKGYTYRLFLEQAHALLRSGGRLGLIVPSGVYSDHGSRGLRDLLLDRCRWEWLYGFDNREGLFEIHRSFKYNIIIAQDGGRTEVIQTAFSRSNVLEWECPEKYAVSYSREQAIRLSPRSRALLEIRSNRDLELLETMHQNSVLLGTTGDTAWNVNYAAGDFNLTSDSALFQARTEWELQGYIPDEYSRWLKAKWRPRDRDGPAGHQKLRCEIPSPFILSRDGTHFVAPEDVIDIAFPVHEGRMLDHFDAAAKGWVSGHGRSSVWSEVLWTQKQIQPQFLIGAQDVRNHGFVNCPRVLFMDIVSATNVRTFYGVVDRLAVCGHSAAVLSLSSSSAVQALALTALLNSFAADYAIRTRVSGVHLTWNYLEEAVVPRPALLDPLARIAVGLNAVGVRAASDWMEVFGTQRELSTHGWRKQWALTPHERVRRRCMLDAIAFVMFGLSEGDVRELLRDCDMPTKDVGSFSRLLNPKGFWRVDRLKPPECRQTVLALIAYLELKECVKRHGGSPEKGVEAFVCANDGLGWRLPEFVCLASYGLGRDARAGVSQPVEVTFGPRLLEIQQNEEPSDAAKECSVHAENIRFISFRDSTMSDLETRQNKLI